MDFKEMQGFLQRVAKKEPLVGPGLGVDVMGLTPRHHPAIGIDPVPSDVATAQRGSQA